MLMNKKILQTNLLKLTISFHVKNNKIENISKIIDNFKNYYLNLKIVHEK